MRPRGIQLMTLLDKGVFHLIGYMNRNHMHLANPSRIACRVAVYLLKFAFVSTHSVERFVLLTTLCLTPETFKRPLATKKKSGSLRFLLKTGFSSVKKIAPASATYTTHFFGIIRRAFLLCREPGEELLSFDDFAEVVDILSIVRSYAAVWSKVDLDFVLEFEAFLEGTVDFRVFNPNRTQEVCFNSPE